MVFQFSPFVFPLLLAGLIAVGLVFYISRWLRTRPGATPLLFLAMAAAIWALGYALEIVGSDLFTKVFWGKVQYLGIAGVPLAWMSYAMQYTDRGAWLTRRRVIGLLIIPGITLMLAFTNEAHGLIWRETYLDDTAPFLALGLEHGAFFWVYWIYSQILILIGTVLVILALIQRPHVYRKQAAVLLIAVLIPWISNGAYIAGLTPIPQLDLTPFAFTMSAIAMTWGISQFHLVDLSPIAREMVMENMRDGVVVLDGDNRIADMNPAAERLLGTPLKDVLGKGATKPLSEFPELLERLHRLSPEQEKLVVHGGPESKYFELRISALKTKQGQINGRLVVIQDITEFVQARDQALEASHLKSQLLARISHELRTPLGAILGFAELLQDGSYGPLQKEQTEVIAEIIESTYDLTTMVNELLDEAQFEARSIQLQLAPFNVLELMHKVEMKMGIRLRQILVNLIGNAIKFTPKGKVFVKFYCADEQHWAMEVSDTGPGIPEEAQSYVFEPFRQVDGSITREFGGTGLGLSIVKHLTELMEGSIHLKSQPGKGSTFTILLPLYPIKEETS